MPPKTREPEPPRGNRVPWEAITQALGAGAALAAWIAVVGGGRVWAKLHAAEIPATQTLSVLPRQLLIVEGLQTLFIPLLIGAGLAVFVYYSRERTAKEGAAQQDSANGGEQGSADPEASDPGGETAASENPVRWLLGMLNDLAPLKAVRGLRNRHGDAVLATITAVSLIVLLVLVLAIAHAFQYWFVMMGCFVVGVVVAVLILRLTDSDPGAIVAFTALVLISIVGVLVAMGLVVKPQHMVGMAAVTAAALWVTIGALTTHRDAKGVAVTLFAAFAVWSGTILILRDLGARDPQLEFATVTRTDGTTVDGFYLGGGAGDVYLATKEPPQNDAPRKVILVKSKDVASLEFGGLESVPLEGDKTKDTAEPAPTPTGGEQVPDSPPAVRKPLTHVIMEIEGRMLRLDVGLTLGRRLVVVDLRLTQLRTRGMPPAFTVGNLFDDNEREPSHSTDGVRFEDLDGSRKYPAARDPADRCLCSGDLQTVKLEAGQSVLLTTTLGRPPGDRLVLVVPRFGSLALSPE